MTFSELNLIAPLLKAVEYEKYGTPSPIQKEAIPLLLAGRDLFGCAQTGTGKTAAFALPILQTLYNQRQGGGKKRLLQALVLTPTRELAAQISDSFKAYGRFAGLRSAVVYGGVSQSPQAAALKNGVDILIATPGRLNDLINQRLCNLRDISMLVLDEADHMLDLGFIHDVKRIISYIPAERQTLLFSATMPKEITKLAASILRDPVTVAVTPVSSPVEVIDQQVYFVEKANKARLLVDLLQGDAIRSGLIFSRTKHGADKICRMLSSAGIRANAIHGNKSQTARQDALAEFKKGKIRVLVATDIAARGIDIDRLSHVINYDLPNVPETYVHRIGRTGRAGLKGSAISFCDSTERPFLRDIQRLIKTEVAVANNHPYASSALEPVESAMPTRQSRPGRGPRAGSPASFTKSAQRPAGPRRWAGNNDPRKRQSKAGKAAGERNKSFRRSARIGS